MSYSKNVNKLKVAIYCRVSSQAQNNQNQKEDLVRYAKAMNWDYDIFEEKKSSRKTRPVKNQIYQNAIMKKYDIVLVWKLDRWARSLKELVNDLEVFKINNVQFKSLTDNITLDNSPTNLLMIQILGAFAEFERNINRERTLAGLEVAKKNGSPIGKRGPDKGRRKRMGYLLRWASEREKAIV